MNAHVSHIARTCYNEMRHLPFFRIFRPSTATVTLVSALTLSRNDHCNKLQFDSTHDVTSHLQRIQNYTARVILRIQKTCNVATQLKSLHWPPIKVRNTYKIYYLCYHCHSSTAPSYMPLKCNRKCNHSPETLAPAHMPSLFSIEQHIVRQHLVIARFLLLLLLSGTLYRWCPWNVPHHCHHLSLVLKHTTFAQFTKTELSLWSVYICSWFGHVLDLLTAFLRNALMCVKKKSN